MQRTPGQDPDGPLPIDSRCALIRWQHDQIDVIEASGRGKDFWVVLSPLCGCGPRASISFVAGSTEVAGPCKRAAVFRKHRGARLLSP